MKTVRFCLRKIIRSNLQAERQGDLRRSTTGAGTGRQGDRTLDTLEREYIGARIGTVAHLTAPVPRQKSIYVSR
jgi:hypothetical protein